MAPQRAGRRVVQFDDRTEEIGHSAGDTAYTHVLQNDVVEERRQGSPRRSISESTLAWEDSATCGVAAYSHEARRILQLAAPLVLSGFLSYSLSLMSLAFIGRVGEHEMSTAVLATSLLNVTAMSLIYGFVGALETVAGQAYGARNYRACGVALQRSVLLSLLLTALVAAFWTQIEAILLALGQDPMIARSTARYLHLAIPTVAAAGVAESMKHYLQTMGIVTPATVVSAVGVAVAPLLNWLFIFKFRLGLDGAVLAMNASELIMLGAMLACTAWHHRRLAGSDMQTWHGWSWEALQGWGEFLRLGVPSTVMVCLEWWAYEVAVILSGWLPNPARSMAAMGVCLNISGFAYMLPYGLASATSVRVSNALGAGLPCGARRTARTACGMTLCTQASLALVVALGRRLWPALFTNVEAVIATAASLLPIVAIMMFGDGLNATAGGVLRGAGRQSLGAVLMLGSFWVVGLPTAAYLAFEAGWGLKGLWSGLAVATTLQATVMLCSMAGWDWHREAWKAAERSGGSGLGPA